MNMLFQTTLFYFPFKVLRDCQEFVDAGFTVSGIYRVDPLDGGGGFGVYCDQQTAGGGWIVILRRYDGSLYFNRGWDAYLNGLGDITGEYWMGLAPMRRLTGANQFTIRFDLEAPDGEKRYAEYAGSTLGDSGTKFRITVGTYSGERNPQSVYSIFYSQKPLQSTDFGNFRPSVNLVPRARGSSGTGAG